MTAFPEDFLQTIVNVSWPSLEMVFGAQEGLWPDFVATATGDLNLSINAGSGFSGVKFSPVLPKNQFRASPAGSARVTWTPTTSGFVSTPLCVIHAWLGKKLKVAPGGTSTTDVTWEGAVVYVHSATFNPSQVPNPPFTSDQLTIDFVKKTLVWQY